MNDNDLIERLNNLIESRAEHQASQSSRREGSLDWAREHQIDLLINALSLLMDEYDRGE